MKVYFFERGAKVKTVHIKSKPQKSISLLIVPHSKEISQINIATWIPKFFLGLILVVLLTSGYLTYDLYSSHNRLKESYDEKAHILKDLEELNEQQKREIENLRLKSAEVQEKLDSIAQLQETVRNLVGLEKTSEESTNNDASPSRGGPALRRSSVMDYEDIDLNTKMKELSSQLDQSSLELSTLIDDVEKRLKYLDAKPNLMPTSGRITSGFGNRKNPFGRGTEFHNGIDIANSSGTKIKAAGSGVVTFAGYSSGYGRYIIISHGYGYQSIYGHNRKLLVKVGDKVEKGQIISEMGSTGRSTGTHLHFEVRLNGKSVNPMNVINNMD